RWNRFMIRPPRGLRGDAPPLFDHHSAMRAIEMQKGGGPEVLEVVEKPLPQPAAGEVRVRAEAIGISSADMLVRKGVYSWMPPLPAIPGNEMAGIVDAVGPKATGVRVGQPVLVSSRELSFRGG